MFRFPFSFLFASDFWPGSWMIKVATYWFRIFRGGLVGVVDSFLSRVGNSCKIQTSFFSYVRVRVVSSCGRGRGRYADATRGFVFYGALCMFSGAVFFLIGRACTFGRC